MVDLREVLRRDLRRHPRVTHQGLLAGDAAVDALAAGLPAFVPFQDKTYEGALWILDWDHRLPSRGLVLRLYAFYGEVARRAGMAAHDERVREIAREDIFPEFDVPDFSVLPADEAYECEVDLEGKVTKTRLASEWRRRIEPKLARRAEEIVRRSRQYKEISSEVRMHTPGLGELEAAEWSPPAESGHARWGIDVWYLRAFNGMVGQGTAFLVDVDGSEVLTQRDFQFRAG